MVVGAGWNKPTGAHPVMATAAPAAPTAPAASSARRVSVM
jgi:hypothetical protein